VGYFWTILTLVVALGSPGATLAPTWPPSLVAACISSAGPSAPSTAPLHEPDQNRPGRVMPPPWSSSRGLARAHVPDPAVPGVFTSKPATPRSGQAALSFNTAASFLTNTNWQNYGGETTMSYFSQVGALTSSSLSRPPLALLPPSPLCEGFRGAIPPPSVTSGRLTRCLFYILLPIAFVAGIIFVGQARCKRWRARSVSTTPSTG